MVALDKAALDKVVQKTSFFFLKTCRKIFLEFCGPKEHNSLL